MYPWRFLISIVKANFAYNTMNKDHETSSVDRVWYILHPSTLIYKIYSVETLLQNLFRLSPLASKTSKNCICWDPFSVHKNRVLRTSWANTRLKHHSQVLFSIGWNLISKVWNILGQKFSWKTKFWVKKFLG